MIIYRILSRKIEQYGDNRHNLALQQVLEKAEDYKISKEAVKVNKLGADYIFWYDLKLAITSLQKE